MTKIYIDENLPLNIADWLAKIGQVNAVVITQDIHRNHHQRELYRQHNVGVFFLSPPSHLPSGVHREPTLSDYKSTPSTPP